MNFILYIYELNIFFDLTEFYHPNYCILANFENEKKIVYSQEYVDFVRSLNINSFSIKNLHETVQHLNEIIETSKENSSFYVVFCTKHFSSEFVNLEKLHNWEKLSCAEKIKEEKPDLNKIVDSVYFPDAVIYNSLKNDISLKIQFKTNFSQRIDPLYVENKFNYYNTKYDSYFNDIIKINYINQDIYNKIVFNKDIDFSKYPRIIKTNITPDYILKNREIIYNFLKKSRIDQISIEKKVYQSFLSKYNIWKFLK